MEQPQMEVLLEFFKALSQVERLQIIGLLIDEPRTVTELAEALAVKETAVIRHLNQLKKAGLIVERTVAFSATYQLNSGVLEWLDDVLSGRVSVESHQEGVMRRYVQGAQLKEIPLNPEDRMVILRWLAEYFEPGKQYSEKEVNDIIRQHYHKQTTLRRILVDNYLLKRTGGVYWRPLTN